MSNENPVIFVEAGFVLISVMKKLLKMPKDREDVDQKILNQETQLCKNKSEQIFLKLCASRLHAYCLYKVLLKSTLRFGHRIVSTNIIGSVCKTNQRAIT